MPHKQQWPQGQAEGSEAAYALWELRGVLDGTCHHACPRTITD